MLLSGLGLVTTLAGHVFLAGRLRQLETRLGQIEQNTRKTVQLLEAVQHSHLQEALDQLRHAQSPDVAERVRHGCLMAAKQSFGRLVHQYQRLWGDRKE